MTTIPKGWALLMSGVLFMSAVVALSGNVVGLVLGVVAIITGIVLFVYAFSDDKEAS